MKAVILKRPGVVEVADVDKPECPHGGALVKVMVCAVCSTDVSMCKKGHPALSYPVIPGHEIAGTVVEASPSVSDLKAGDRVVVGPGINCGNCRFCRDGLENLCASIKIVGFNHPGGMAEYIALPRKMIAGRWIKKIPRELDAEEAALSEPLACCINGIEKLEIDESSRVLIIGGGPVGCILGWLCKEKGAARVTIAEKDGKRRQRVRDLNSAHEVITDITESDSFDVLIPACRHLPDTDILDLKLEKGGQLLLFSGTSGESRPFFDLIKLVHYREWTVMGAYGCRPAQIEEALHLIGSGTIPVGRLIDCRVEIDQVYETFKLVERRECLKAVILFREMKR